MDTFDETLFITVAGLGECFNNPTRGQYPASLLPDPRVPHSRESFHPARPSGLVRAMQAPGHGYCSFGGQVATGLQSCLLEISPFVQSSGSFH